MSFHRDGFEIVDDFISEPHLLNILSELELSGQKICGGGLRSPEKVFDAVKSLIDSPELLQRAESYLGSASYFVRAILFDKTPSNNWLVSWHQDKTIAVSHKKNILGWGPWSVKGDYHHVQPDIGVLNNMVTFRLHLDASTEENGCIRLIPGSHEQGLLAASEIASCVEKSEFVLCEAKRASALVMRPHILHASSKASKPSSRKVLHVEYSSYSLPEGLQYVD